MFLGHSGGLGQRQRRLGLERRNGGPHVRQGLLAQRGGSGCSQGQGGSVDRVQELGHSRTLGLAWRRDGRRELDGRREQERRQELHRGRGLGSGRGLCRGRGLSRRRGLWMRRGPGQRRGLRGRRGLSRKRKSCRWRELGRKRKLCWWRELDWRGLERRCRSRSRAAADVGPGGDLEGSRGLGRGPSARGNRVLDPVRRADQGHNSARVDLARGPGAPSPGRGPGRARGRGRGPHRVVHGCQGGGVWGRPRAGEPGWGSPAQPSFLGGENFTASGVPSGWWPAGGHCYMGFHSGLGFHCLGESGMPRNRLLIPSYFPSPTGARNKLRVLVSLLNQPLNALGFFFFVWGVGIAPRNYSWWWPG